MMGNRRRAVLGVATAGCCILLLGLTASLGAEPDFTLTVQLDEVGLSPLRVLLLGPGGLQGDWTDPEGTAQFQDVEDGPIAAATLLMVSSEEQLVATALRRGHAAFGLAMLYQPGNAPVAFMAWDGQATFDVDPGLAYLCVFGWMW